MKQRPHMPFTHMFAALSASLFISHVVVAQSTEPDPAPPAEEKPAPAEEPLPDLDELLGLPGEDDDDADAPPLSSPEDLELERALDAQTVSEMFQQAIQQRADAATLRPVDKSELRDLVSRLVALRAEMLADPRG